MDIAKRLTRKPLTTILWILIVVLMTGFLSVGTALYYSSERLARELDSRHTAIAVRTDPAAHEEDGAMAVDRRFTLDDVRAIEAFDSVKAVRSHTLAGGTSPAFCPITDTRKELSWRSSGSVQPYYNAVLSGTVISSALYDDGMLIVGAQTGEVLLLNPEFHQAEPLLKYMGCFVFAADASECPEAADYFVPGERYVFSGIFDPRHAKYDPRYSRSVSGMAYTVYAIDAGTVYKDNGCLMGVPAAVRAQLDRLESPVPYSYPAADRLDCAPEDFFEIGGHDIWRDYRGAWEKQNHSLPVIGTDRLESMFIFVHGDAEMIEGRTFTPEEYSGGARVMIISDRTADKAGLKVGDRITMSQFRLAGGDIDVNATTRAKTGEALMNPNADLICMDTDYSDEEEFEIVGLYRLRADWSLGTYSITPNTVFIPRPAQISGAFCSIPEASEAATDVYGPYLSIELKNGSVEDFRLALSGSPYSGQFYTFDQGFEMVQKNLNGLALTSSRLMWIAAAGWVFFLILFILMYQGGQKKNLGVLRSLGRTPRQAALYLAGSGLMTALIGVITGTGLSAAALNTVQAGILKSALDSMEAAGNASVLSGEALAELISRSMPGFSQLAVLGCAQLVLMAAFIIIHALILARRSPRELSAA